MSEALSISMVIIVYTSRVYIYCMIFDLDSNLLFDDFQFGIEQIVPSGMNLFGMAALRYYQDNGVCIVVECDIQFYLYVASITTRFQNEAGNCEWFKSGRVAFIMV